MNYEKRYFLIGLCEQVSECYVGPQISNFELWWDDIRPHVMANILLILE